MAHKRNGTAALGLEVQLWAIAWAPRKMDPCAESSRFHGLGIPSTEFQSGSNP